MSVVYKNITLFVNIEADDVVAEVLCELEFEQDDELGEMFDYDITRITVPSGSDISLSAELFNTVILDEYITRRFSVGPHSVNDGDVLHLTLPTPRLIEA